MSRTIVRNDLNEPSTRSTIRFNVNMLAFVVYWYAPVAYGMWLWQDLKMGAFSADSDSIAIPLFAFMVLWFVGFPFFLLTTVAFEMRLHKCDRRKSLRLSGIRTRG